MIKEASIDSLNYNDTVNTKEPFTCFKILDHLLHQMLILLFQILIEKRDVKRVISKVKWTPRIIKAKIKGETKRICLKTCTT